MLSNNLITTQYPTLDYLDSVLIALQLMDDYDIQHLPVVSEEKFIGLVSKDDLLDANENELLQAMEEGLIKKAVKPGDHFLAALKLASGNGLSLVPVVTDDSEWVGGITTQELLRAVSAFVGADEPGALIVLEMERSKYSFGEISRLVETNDAFITQFNTALETETGLMIVTLRMNKLMVSNIIATFQRYEYTIRYFVGEEEYENELRYNYDHLMSYLKI